MQWNLIRLRKEAGFRQKELAEIIGISEDAYGYKERGQRPFDLDEMFILRDLFHVHLEDIFLPSDSIKNRVNNAKSTINKENPVSSFIET